MYGATDIFPYNLDYYNHYNSISDRINSTTGIVCIILAIAAVAVSI
jgi:hypothetical protein